MSALRLSRDELVFGWEPLADLLVNDSATLADLFFQHWEEMGVHRDRMTVDPDWPRFLQLNDAGILRLWTARDETHELVGYLTCYVQPHIDFRSILTCEFGPYFLQADHRRGIAGFKLFSTALEHLKAMGVQRFIGHSRIGKLDAIFKRLGFDPLDQTWDMLV